MARVEDEHIDLKPKITSDHSVASAQVTQKLINILCKLPPQCGHDIDNGLKPCSSRTRSPR